MSEILKITKIVKFTKINGRGEACCERHFYHGASLIFAYIRDDAWGRSASYEIL